MCPSCPQSQFPKPTAFTSSGRTHTIDDQEICRNFNGGRCSSSPCRFSHTCSQCGKDHTCIMCNQQQRGANRPPPPPPAPSRMATESLDSVRSFFPIHSTDTPLLADHFARLLRNQPDQSCVAYVLHGLRHGFALGSAGQHDISVSLIISPRLSRTRHVFSDNERDHSSISVTSISVHAPLWYWCLPKKERQAANDPPSV